MTNYDCDRAGAIHRRVAWLVDQQSKEDEVYIEIRLIQPDTDALTTLTHTMCEVTADNAHDVERGLLAFLDTVVGPCACSTCKG